MSLRPVLTFAGLLTIAILLAGSGFVPPLVVALSVPFLVMVAGKPILRRLAVRNAVRRPRETALVLLGSLLGTAIITGSMIVGDTLHSSIRHSAYTQLGPIDELVSPTDARQLPALEQALVHLPPADVGTPRAFNSSAAFRADSPESSSNTLRSPSARSFPSRSNSMPLSRRPPMRTPRALAAFMAALVRSLIVGRSFSASAA